MVIDFRNTFNEKFKRIFLAIYTSNILSTAEQIVRSVRDESDNTMYNSKQMVDY